MEPPALKKGFPLKEVAMQLFLTAFMSFTCMLLYTHKIYYAIVVYMSCHRQQDRRP